MGAKIKFRNKFNCPDRINGKPKALKELGIKVLGRNSKDSFMWDYENVKIEMKTKTFSNVEIDWNDEKDCCDICFSNGVCFGYVDDDDFRILDEEL